MLSPGGTRFSGIFSAVESRVVGQRVHRRPWKRHAHVAKSRQLSCISVKICFWQLLVLKEVGEILDVDVLFRVHTQCQCRAAVEDRKGFFVY